jgi:plasmid stability protein
MANISVRQLDPNTVAALRQRAASRGVSMEEEVRRILEQAVKSDERMGTRMERIFSSSWDGERFDPSARRNPVTPMSFDKPKPRRKSEK